ncbi:TPA: DUF1033 family protein [Streptococcus suis]
MYQVIKMYGDFEPWWFIDGWEEDIVSLKNFSSYEEALRYYQKEWVHLSEEFSEKKSQNGMMTAFWDPKDQYWCEECDEYLQHFHSLMLVESREVLPQGFRKKERLSRVRPCQLRNKEKLG